MMTSRGTTRNRRLRVAVVGLLALAAAGGVATSGWPASASFEPSGLGCDEVPTGVATRDHWLHFNVPAGLMPDPQFDGRPAKLEVHRVSPVYANGKCPWVSNRAVVLVHGRTVTGPVVFDLRDPATGGGELSVQEALARAGIDTFAPSLLGYGRSTRFDEGLNDPGNASLRPYLADGTCPYPEGCDRTTIPFLLDQQGTSLAVNPLAGERRAHSSNFRFARTDVWVRDIRQVIDDAIARAKPTDGKVALLGYSLGGPRVGRTLYAANPNPILPGSADVIAKVSRVVFLSSLFGGPTEEPATVTAPTFPLAVNADPGRAAFSMTSTARDEACTGHVIAGVPDQLWAQTLKLETLGREWGGNDPAHPTGLNRSPTFSSYGWNASVAGQLTTPTLVMQGLEDVGVPGGPANAPAIFNALPASMTNKVLVQVECASHGLPWEGCAGPRCEPASGTPYGGTPGTPWAGPHATLKAALIEWIESGTFNGAMSGRFIVDESGLASAVP